MYQGQIRVIVAIIILGGHFLVFFFGLLLGVFGPLIGADAVQTVLMASPVLAVTATAALMFALRGEVGIHRGRKVTSLFAFVTHLLPYRTDRLCVRCVLCPIRGVERISGRSR